MKIAVLQYSTYDVDIIEVTDEQLDASCKDAQECGDWEFDDMENDTERIECYLSVHCGYDPSDINYMSGDDDKIKVNKLDHNSFG